MRITLILATLTLVALLMAGTSYATTEFGIKGGLNLANMNGDGIDAMIDALEFELGGSWDKSMRTGFAFGIYNHYRFSNGPMGLQIELLYTMKGIEFSGEYMGVDVDETFALNYIEVPFLLKYTVPTEGSFSPNLFAGPSIGYLVSAKIKAEAQGQSEEMDIKDAMKDFDIGIAFGAGFDIALGEKTRLTFDGRYTIGLTGVADTDADNSEMKNSAFTFLAGIVFPLGK